MFKINQRIIGYLYFISFFCSTTASEPWVFPVFFTSALPIGSNLLSIDPRGLSITGLVDLQYEQTLLLWKEHIDNVGPFVLETQPFTFDLIILRDGENKTQLVNNFFLGVGRQRGDLYIAPFAPVRLSSVLFSGIDSLGFPSLSLFNEPSFQLISNSLFAIQPSNPQQLDSALLHLRINGGKSLVMVYIDDGGIFTGLCRAQSVQKKAEKYGILLLDAFPLSRDINGSFIDSNQVEDVIPSVRALDADLIIFCSLDAQKKPFMEALLAHDYLPRMLVLLPSTARIADPSFFELTLYVHEPIYWSPLSAFSDPIWSDSTNFSFAFFDKFGSFPSGGLASGLLAGLAVYQKAIEDAILFQLRRNITLNKPSPAEMIFFISRAVAPSTLIGEVRFDATNANTGEGFGLVQRFPDALLDNDIPKQFSTFNGTNVPVYPPRSAIISSVYPMPTWEEREYNPQFASQTSEIIVGIFIGICSFISIAWACFILLMHKQPAIQYASPGFLLLMLFGSILMYNAIWGWMIYVTSEGCQAMPWLFWFGFVAFISALLIKNFRIHKVCSAAASFRTYKLPYPYIFGMLLAIFFPIFILLLVWTLLAPLEAQLYTPDPFRPSQNYTRCSSSGTSDIFLWLLIGYTVLLLISLIVLTIKTWKIDRAILNESFHIASATYVWSLAMLVALIIVATNAVDLEIEFLIRSFCVLAGTCFAVCIIMTPKVFFIRSGKSFLDVSGSRSRTSS